MVANARLGTRPPGHASNAANATFGLSNWYTAQLWIDTISIIAFGDILSAMVISYDGVTHWFTSKLKRCGSEIMYWLMAMIFWPV